MGKTAITVFGLNFNKHCKCAHVSHPSKCCNSTTVTLKAIDDPYTAPFKLATLLPQLVDIILAPLQFSLAPLAAPVASANICRVPLLQGIALSTLFCVYRI